MKKNLLQIIVLFAMFSVNAQTYSGGSGTISSPYQIASLADLQYLSEHSSEWVKYFIQTANVDASVTNTWNSGAGFSPIGNSSLEFTGSYNGQAHTISNLFINRPSEDNIALFGNVSSSSIDSLGILDVDITGNAFVGGLVGIAVNSNISNSRSSGSVTGNDYVGGLVGQNDDSAVNNSYSTASLSGFNSVGGLVGGNISSTISNSYSTGSVSGYFDVGGFVGGSDDSSLNNSYSIGSVTGTSEIGGFVGRSYNSTISNSFWNTDADNITGTVSGDNNYGATGKTTTEMQTLNTYTYAPTIGLLNAWDFTGTENDDAEIEDIWVMVCTGSYPFLSWEGRMTETNPYPIATIEDLRWLSENICLWDKHFIQTADIDASATNTWNGGAGFSPIGNNSVEFTGSYNGQAHTISNLFINRPSEFHIALFGYTLGSSIDNLGVINVDITGNSYIGGLVGVNGSVNGTYSTIGNSYSSGSVTGTGTPTRVGGLVGENGTSSIINNSYSTSTVSGITYVGGLVGFVWSSTISNSYSTSLVSGVNFVGGIAGSSISPPSNCFWNTDIYTTDNGVGTGKTTLEMQNLCTYLNADWDFLAETDNGIGNDWSINENVNSGYPTLTWQALEHTGICCGITHPTFNETEVLTICDNETFVFGTQTLDASNAGENTEIFQSVYGCDSTVTLNLTIIHSSTGTDIQTAFNSYLWIDGNTYTANNNTASHTLTNVSGCDSVVTLNLTVIDNTVDENSVILTANASGVSYQWVDCDNNYVIITGETNQDYTPLTNGNYAVIVVYETYTDTSDCVNVSTVGIDNLSNSGILLMPNPVNNVLQVKGNQQMQAIAILDNSGKTIKVYSVNNTDCKIDMSELQTGIYFIKIETENSIYIDKVIKQ